MKKQTGRTQRLISALSGRYFFGFIVALLAVQALWIAFSARFPMAFDEDFHLGIIRLYSHHVSPFWQAQPSGADSFGAVARDPSYLYHYLMSFPYRLIVAITDNGVVQIMTLRIINIGLLAGGLVVWRKLLLKSGASRAIVHSCLLAFVLLPIVPLLAAQINYDNLFIPLVGLVFLLAANVGEELRNYGRLNTKLVLQLLIACLLTSLVKYAFLPIFVGVVLYLLVRSLQTPGGWRKLLLSLAFGWTLMTRTTRRSLVIILILSTGLFVQRYAVNIVRYQQPVPDCDKVLSVKQCSAYGPWVRNYTLTTNKSSDASTSPQLYTADWFYGMWLRTFFAVAGPANKFETRGPLLLPGIGAVVFASVALMAIIVGARGLWQRYNRSVLTLFLVIIICYIALLWLDGYRSFVQVGQTVAVNGRYLLPVALPIMLLGALGINGILGKRRDLKAYTAAVMILCLAWGGGTMTYILRSRDAWYWQNSSVQRINDDVRRTVGPLVPGYRHPIEFMSRN